MIGDVIHFTAHTIRPNVPHTVVWYGTLEGDTLKVDGAWTTRRWYWTNRIEITATSVPAPPATACVSG
jgi:hypothetical protein